MNARKKRQQKQASSGKTPYRKVVVLSGIVLSIVVYIVIRNISEPPPLPEIDLNKYWGSGETSYDTSIRHFNIVIPDEIINDLKERLLHTRKMFPPIENSGFQYGMNSIFMEKVVDFWRNKYDFKEREKFFNKFDHYVTKIQGLEIHFLNIKMNHDGINNEVVPILLLHGWPGSFRDFYDVIPELIKLRPEKKFAFEVIVPSLPGFPMSEGTTRPGLDVLEVAVIMHNLMERLGHRQYYVHGSHIGHLIGSAMATAFPDNVLGFHTSTPLITNPSTIFQIFFGALWPSLIEPNEDLVTRLYPLFPHLFNIIRDTGYLHFQASTPDTIGLALEDSPVGLAAYMLDIYAYGTNPKNKEAYDGKITDNYHLTTLLDNILLYWASQTVTTSMRLYAETFNSKRVTVVLDKIPTEVPTAGIKFKHDISYQPDSILRQKYKNYLRSSVVETGGRFPALEQPALLANDIIEAVDLFVKFNHNQQPSGNIQPSQPSRLSVYDFTVDDIHGSPVKLDRYKGKVLIVVNVASHCGLTQTNYKELNDLYEKYYNKGLRILAFPCNQFNSQEPGTSEEILTFVKDIGVKFDLFAKVEVNGEQTHPLWKFLKSSLGGTFGEFIKWNFSKFIVDKYGNPVERFGPNVNPIDMEPYLIKYLSE